MTHITCSVCKLECLNALSVKCPHCGAVFCDDETCLGDHVCGGRGSFDDHIPERTTAGPITDHQARYQQRAALGQVPPVAPPSQPLPQPLTGEIVMSENANRLFASKDGQTRGFAKVQEAADALGVNMSSIHLALKVGRPTKGWTLQWRDAQGKPIAAPQRRSPTPRGSRTKDNPPPPAPSARTPATPSTRKTPEPLPQAMTLVPATNDGYGAVAEPLSGVFASLATLAAGSAGLRMEDVLVSWETTGGKVSFSAKTLQVVRTPAVSE
jgi:hypothetical protein